jgi:homoserine kinase type II
MSVYTKVSFDELSAWLSRYALSPLTELTPIASGIENTNYFVTTEHERLVLTLYERLPPEDLPFYLNLMAHLVQHGVPAPAPIADRSGAYFSLLHGKPASLVRRLEGTPRTSPSPVHCAEIGRALAQMHVATRTFRSRHANPRGAAWRTQAARAVKRFLTPAQVELLAEQMELQRTLARLQLPHGAIHGDLFRDNALFVDDTLSGIIDFGFAATDFFAYDLAITVNDWCIDADCGLDPDRTRALIDAYHAMRPLVPAEIDAWPSLLRLAALRFWLSRLYDLHLPRPGELTHAHDPEHFERVLRARARASGPPLVAA